MTLLELLKNNEDPSKEMKTKNSLSFQKHSIVTLILSRVTRGRYSPILSPSHRVVEQQLFIPGFLQEFLETSGDQENLRFLEKVGNNRNCTRVYWVEVEQHDHYTTATS